MLLSVGPSPPLQKGAMQSAAQFGAAPLPHGPFVGSRRRGVHGPPCRGLLRGRATRTGAAAGHPRPPSRRPRAAPSPRSSDGGFSKPAPLPPLLPESQGERRAASPSSRPPRPGPPGKSLRAGTMSAETASGPTQDQVEILEYNFNKVNKHPDPTTLLLIAAEAGLSEEETQKWFKQRLAQWRKSEGLPSESRSVTD